MKRRSTAERVARDVRYGEPLRVLGLGSSIVLHLSGPVEKPV